MPLGCSPYGVAAGAVKPGNEDLVKSESGGIYATLFLLAIALTGLTWSFSWYRTGFYSLFEVEASAEGNGGHGGNRAAAGEPARGGHARTGRKGDRHHRPASLRMFPFTHWQEVYEALAQSHPGYRQITLSDGSAIVVPAGRNSLRAGDRFDFDTKSGRITCHTPYAEQDKSTHLRSTVYTVHVGSWGGLLTRIITFFAALLGATLSLTGYYLWIRRRHGLLRHLHIIPHEV